ncbi:Endocytosis protein end4 [Wickerhamomyces ciferrii]|uniref:Endocytosis protein end4 n=1 Tax=Wickerhamomyces ciferrii (strain ATCC 14091 / BCRC 22168 / CBS 111 / JCM 3599 / NBRC 0793 / NRRL Y-1031 F-60-10) TaxID=1206466 RepID=K0KM26_WICCF|nr:Endocytosis protein end4 [Wickerhamomyces ciferrii]CCH42178.1 Endocytosis protein end4 [Wickerhamomyces ciferrii]
MSKPISETDLQTSIRKACSPDETAPKRKHVRACIVYTWDHKSSKAFWNAVKIQPIQTDEVQLFKALITIHKVLQEGHQSALKDAVRNTGWIESLGRSIHGDGFKGYGRLIKEYTLFLLRKLHFHKNHRGFNGTFEYEEYVSLVTVQNPDEGYEAILDLMSLQDALDDFQRLIFASISHDKRSECKISALVPLVAESYGIYKFITSMLRAIYRSTGSEDALQPLRERYDSQHSRLYEFYADCSSIRYLTSLITIPRLPGTPPNLFVEDEDEDGASRPRSRQTIQSQPTTSAPSPEPVSSQPTNSQFQQPIPTQPTGVDFWNNQQSNYEAEQQRLLQQQQQQALQQQQYAEQQRQLFEQQQQQQAEQQRLAQEQLYREQLQSQAQGRVAELERDLLNLRGQYERDQLLLGQYDQRVQALESEIANTTQSATQQLASKDELANSLQEQLGIWKSKYESLAKLYSQLRQEHLNLLNKFKKLQQKAASAQEAIDRREKLEKDLKAKNVELAGLIRERDRARLDLEKVKGGKDGEIDNLELQIRDLTLKLDDSERSQSSNLSSIFANHKKEIEALKSQLETQSRALNPDLERQLRDKEEELEIVQQTMDDALQELARVQQENDTAIDEQIDEVLSDHLSKLTSLVDAILQSGIKRIQDSIYELDSPMQAGNQNSSPEYLLSVIEKASSSATEFANSFNDFIADGPNGDHSAIIQSINDFSSAISDVLLNGKGIVRLLKTDDEADKLILSSRDTAHESEKFFQSLLSSHLQGNEEEKTETVIVGNLNVQEKLQYLINLAEGLAPRSVITKTNGDLGEVVDNELHSAAQAIANASSHLNSLLSKPQDPSLSQIDFEINKAILSAAIAVTNAIALLISAAIETQEEIVSQNKGSGTRAQYYKKHNRWTEGLISAAKAVAGSTKILISTADGVLGNKNSHEELIVASNEVAASTAQLVAASRVKATFMSKSQEKLEVASKTVTSACRVLVNQVQDILSKRTNGGENEIDYSKLTNHENKTVEMEQQVEILKLENALGAARKRLGEIRKYGYRDGDSDEE